MATKKKAAKKKAPARKKTPGKSDPPKKKDPRGRKPFVPTAQDRHTVKLLIGFGIELENIAAQVINPKTGKGISKTTLREHFAEELRAGKGAVESKLAGSLFKRATDLKNPGGAASAMFMLKCKHGWKEKQEVELTAKSGVLIAPVRVSAKEWIENEEAKADEKEAPE